VSEETRGNG